jgi:DUF1680 family protein
VTDGTFYRGVAYDLRKVGSQWLATVPRPDGRFHRFQDRTQRAVLQHVHRVIDIRLDFDGDGGLYDIVESLVQRIAVPNQSWWSTQTQFTRKQILHRLDRAYEFTRRRLEALPDNNDALVEKLQRMTVDNGCSPAEAEAEAAAEKLRRLRVVR